MAHAVARPALPVAVTLALLLLVALPPATAQQQRKPNIVIIVADDLGWNDVSAHGSDQIQTPNIDALIYSGVLLHRHYVQPVCTPTRAALMTSKYPLRMGLQGSPLVAGELRSMPTGKILPEYLRDRGYATHAVGKWHLGFYKAEYTPTKRGFDTHLGYWNGLTSYYDHLMGFEDTASQPRGMFGYDMRHNMSTAWELRGRYATDVFTERAEKVIAEHDSSRPLFLYLAHLAVHAGNNGELLEAPRSIVNKLDYIDNPNRRTYAGILRALDESVGRVVKALEDSRLLSNTIILFIADNGAPTLGVYQNWGSNYPLRGMKDTFWEGGVRGIAALWGPMLNKRSVVLAETMHVTDWLPTLYAAAGGNEEDLVQPMDGVNQWEMFVGDAKSGRNETVINIDEVQNASAILQGRWKLVQGTKSEYNGYYGDSGVQKNAPRLQATRVWSSPAGSAIGRTLGRKKLLNQRSMEQMRKKIAVSCNHVPSTCDITDPSQYCLFDILSDPCELNNVADENPEKAQELLGAIEAYREVLVPQTDGNLDLTNADPRRWNRTWTPWVTCEQSPDISWCNASPGAVSS